MRLLGYREGRGVRRCPPPPPLARARVGLLLPSACSPGGLRARGRSAQVRVLWASCHRHGSRSGRARGVLSSFHRAARSPRSPGFRSGFGGRARCVVARGHLRQRRGCARSRGPGTLCAPAIRRAAMALAPHCHPVRHETATHRIRIGDRPYSSKQKGKKMKRAYMIVTGLLALPSYASRAKPSRPCRHRGTTTSWPQIRRALSSTLPTDPTTPQGFIPRRVIQQARHMPLCT